MFNILSHNPPVETAGLIAGLPDEIRDALFSAGARRPFTTGQTIHIVGDRTANLTIILEGEIGFGRLDEDGRYIPATALGPGNSFGELPLFADLPRTHDATAHSDGMLIEISKPRLLALMDEVPALRDHFLANLARMLAISLDLLDDERRLPIVTRVAKYLEKAIRANDGMLEIVRKQEQIANDLGVSRSSVVAAIGELASAGLVAPLYGRIAIPDLGNLREWVARHG